VESVVWPAHADWRRAAALGIAHARALESPTDPNDVGEACEPATVEGVKCEWRVDPSPRGTVGFPLSTLWRSSAQGPLSGTSEQLALCAVKLLEFDYPKRRGSITRIVGRWSYGLRYGLVGAAH
jgi:hypothetical protein